MKDKEAIFIDTTTSIGVPKIMSIRRNGTEVAYKDADGIWHIVVETRPTR
jgi:hypothetical protein